MQYMILIYEPEGCYDGEAGQAALQDIVAKHMALAGELRAKGIQKDGAGLQGVETATTVVTEGGRQTIHDGPFAETREHLGGYYLIDVPNLDDAISIARRVPVMDGGKVEIRPLIVHDQ
ncbi:MAG: YciI family protein [Phenylobacterium sp.]|uniref:YciI family protein n=1 Tax=Phenylobacterium sp. TaxID=1871053 RepID=UPI0025F1D407|nr:YciI family protein [Phenylobacterium sp.]MBI1200018.1 YciI family protein [Phenylobacterium sp.]